MKEEKIRSRLASLYASIEGVSIMDIVNEIVELEVELELLLNKQK